ncbi:MAG TPA: hypothetical protein PKL15_08920 [Saprospiraceae bacterium]|nr:hypothetical protein [Saprospiraceae bacterium]HNM25538.1 hypothetical protein [Saprospiraceae bacterium]
METLLDILKFTIPGLIVFATAYFLLKLYLDDMQRTHQLAARTEAQKVTIPLRLQAYERLTLLCDRLEITNVLLRIRMEGMTVSALKGALLLAIRQEFDHNTSQQLYVSDTLWKIITLAKDETMNLVVLAASGLDPQADDEQLIDNLLRLAADQGQPSPLQRAIMALRAEASQLF